MNSLNYSFSKACHLLAFSQHGRTCKIVLSCWSCSLCQDFMIQAQGCTSIQYQKKSMAISTSSMRFNHADSNCGSKQNTLNKSKQHIILHRVRLKLLRELCKTYKIILFLVKSILIL